VCNNTTFTVNNYILMTTAVIEVDILLTICVLQE